ncbi:ABC transporter ATP-binding protein [Ferrimicrobium sp.]|uniref:ABC transporter ATP-binding protein n=1 Tax=Ferrimicrobium sp. TaxID=2926050 RepID=UPI00262FEDC5|nr:sn-glycerol-3-phosphate ABC transporter ATP-binding protein UgpC [Ferrimicrobium sp.]
MGEVRLEDVSKAYGGQTVVENLHLTVAEGEFVVLLGPSGCGKSTTLRMIAGLETVSSGRVMIGETDVTLSSPSLRNVGMVFQNYALFPHMSAFDNLAFGLKAKRLPKAQIARRVTEVAQMLELEDVLRVRPKNLSGGQRQRVALGRALIRKPSVFLMDEPLSNLDANLRDHVRMELASLHRNLKITTLYVTHDQGEAMTLADRVVVMSAGRIRQIGTPEEIYNEPADTFVAHFIGSPGMNLWSFDAHGESLSTAESSSVVMHPSLLQDLPTSEAEIVIGVRPEHLELADFVETPGIRLAMEVELVERFGSHQLVHGKLAGVGHSIVARMPAELKFEPGSVRIVAADIGRVYVFSAGSGERLHVQARANEMYRAVDEAWGKR